MRKDEGSFFSLKTHDCSNDFKRFQGISALLASSATFQGCFLVDIVVIVVDQGYPGK